MAAGRFAVLTSLRPALIDWPRKLEGTNCIGHPIFKGKSKGAAPWGGRAGERDGGRGAHCRCPHRQAAEAKTPL